jgi:hypothetical protein
MKFERFVLHGDCLFSYKVSTFVFVSDIHIKVFTKVSGDKNRRL